MWWDHMSGYGGMGWGVVTMLLFWAILILAIAVLWRLALRAPQAPGPSQKSAVQILEERYARGEIGQEEFLQKRRDLGGSP